MFDMFFFDWLENMHACMRNALAPDSLAFACRMHGVFANQTFAKYKLKLFPVGQLSTIKPENIKATMCIMHGPEGNFQIQSPKVDFEKCTGMAVPYFHVGKTTDPLLVNMEATTVKIDHFTVPCLRNIHKVEKGTLLLCLKDEKGNKKAKT